MNVNPPQANLMRSYATVSCRPPIRWPGGVKKGADILWEQQWDVALCGSLHPFKSVPVVVLAPSSADMAKDPFQDYNFWLDYIKAQCGCDFFRVYFGSWIKTKPRLLSVIFFLDKVVIYAGGSWPHKYNKYNLGVRIWEIPLMRFIKNTSNTGCP